ncbi:hypothetical protein NEIG_00990 [Nematocida sp. ERTm5]|nr:hypothetical protein NEIG_00990 [Nematocida sp. ERTm5]
MEERNRRISRKDIAIVIIFTVLLIIGFGLGTKYGIIDSNMFRSCGRYSYRTYNSGNDILNRYRKYIEKERYEKFSREFDEKVEKEKEKLDRFYSNPDNWRVPIGGRSGNRHQFGHKLIYEENYDNFQIAEVSNNDEISMPSMSRSSSPVRDDISTIYNNIFTGRAEYIKSAERIYKIPCKFDKGVWVTNIIKKNQEFINLKLYRLNALIDVDRNTTRTNKNELRQEFNSYFKNIKKSESMNNCLGFLNKSINTYTKSIETLINELVTIKSTNVYLFDNVYSVLDIFERMKRALHKHKPCYNLYEKCNGITMGESIIRTRIFYNEHIKLSNIYMSMHHNKYMNSSVYMAILSILSMTEVVYDFKNVFTISVIEEIFKSQKLSDEKITKIEIISKIGNVKNIPIANKNIKTIIVQLYNLIKGISNQVENFEKEEEDTLETEKIDVYIKTIISSLDISDSIFNPMGKHILSLEIDVFNYLYGVLCEFYRNCKCIIKKEREYVKVLGKNVIVQEGLIKCTIPKTINNSVSQEYERINTTIELTGRNSVEFLQIYFVDNDEQVLMPVFIPVDKAFNSVKQIKWHISNLYNIDIDHISRLVYDQSNCTWSFSDNDKDIIVPLDVSSNSQNISVFYYINTGLYEEYCDIDLLFCIFTHKSYNNKNNQIIPIPLFLNSLYIDVLANYAVNESFHDIKQINIYDISKMRKVMAHIITIESDKLSSNILTDSLFIDLSNLKIENIYSEVGNSYIPKRKTIKNNEVLEFYTITPKYMGYFMVNFNLSEDSYVKKYNIPEFNDYITKSLVLSAQYEYLMWVTSNNANYIENITIFHDKANAVISKKFCNVSINKLKDQKIVPKYAILQKSIRNTINNRNLLGILLENLLIKHKENKTVDTSLTDIS